MHWRVALVEDDHRLARAVAAGLRDDGYRVRAVASAAFPSCATTTAKPACSR